MTPSRPARTEKSKGPKPSGSKPTGRRLSFRRLLQPEFYLPVVVTGAFLGAWEWVGTFVDPILFAPPSRIAEAAVALAIFLNYYNNFVSIDVDRADELRG